MHRTTPFLPLVAAFACAAAWGQTPPARLPLLRAQNLPPASYICRCRPGPARAGGAAGGVMAGDIPVTIRVSARPQSELDFSQLQLYRANLSVHPTNSGGDKLIGLNSPTDR